MSKCRITLIGCDDSTHIDLDLTAAELAFTHRLAALSEEAAHDVCNPTLTVEETPDA